MKYFFSLTQVGKIKDEIKERGDVYFTADDIRKIPLKVATKQDIEQWLKDDDSDLWLVYDADSHTGNDDFEVSNEDEAYTALLNAENQIIYEYVHDL